MKHCSKGRKFNRHKGARKALLRALATSFFTYGAISTTLAKAKDIRSVVEKIITKAKKGKSDLSTVRYLYSFLYTKEAVDFAFAAAQASVTRNGGYTRVIKNGFRNGDNAPVGVIELVDREKFDELTPKNSNTAEKVPA
jgi:large subunit ribosomal protein L17